MSIPKNSFIYFIFMYKQRMLQDGLLLVDIHICFFLWKLYTNVYLVNNVNISRGQPLFLYKIAARTNAPVSRFAI